MKSHGNGSNAFIGKSSELFSYFFGKSLGGLSFGTYQRLMRFPLDFTQTFAVQLSTIQGLSDKLKKVTGATHFFE